MTIPKFTADASIGPTIHTYRTPNRYAAPLAPNVQPEMNGLSGMNELAEMNGLGIDGLSDELSIAAMDTADNLAEVDGSSAADDDITVDLDVGDAEDDSTLDDSAAI